MTGKIKVEVSVAAMLAAALVFGLAACGTSKNGAVEADDGEEAGDIPTEGEEDAEEDAEEDEVGEDVPEEEEDVCGPGQVLCGDKCVDTDTDPEHCGECFHECTAPEHAGPTCDGGECGWSCVAGWVDADGDEVNGCECEQSESSETTCTDGADNDCDGLADCEDIDCDGMSCGEHGMVCSEGACTCSLGEPPETACGDGVDNDCDGLADCEDGDCSGESCGAETDLCCGTECVDTLSNFYHCGVCFNDCDSGEVCNEGVCGADCSPGLTDCGGSCVDTDTNVDHCGECFHSCPARENAVRTCAGGECGYTCAENFFDLDGDPANGCECHRTESAESSCGDLTDNDCDGDVDCADADCEGMACSGTGRVCSGGDCICPGGEVHESTCNDSSDNDCDGLADCADTDCDGASCGPYGRICSGSVCVCPGGESSELTCGDGTDNDCDGAIDCADSDCADSDCAERSCGGAGEICCAMTCVDTNTNNNHCGGCGNPCGGTEACVDGACVATCTNECETGQRRCDPGGAEGYQLCGDYDIDPCLEWSSTTLCSGGAVCYGGQCLDPFPPGNVIINEVLYDGASGDEDEAFIELWGDPGIPLDGFNLVGINGANGSEYCTIDLWSMAMPDDGYFVIVHPSAGAALLAEADMQDESADLQNGPDSVQLRWGEDSVVDALGYGDSGTFFAGEGAYAPDVNPALSLSRNRAHWDTDDNLTDFHADASPTPGRNDEPFYNVSSVAESFIDISSTGANTGLTGDDVYTTIPIGFDFPFFGNVYDQVLINSNGMLSFDLTGDLWYTNQELPDGLDPDDVVACFWDDLYVRGAPEIDAIYYESFTSAPDPYLVVQYHDLDFFNSSRNPASLTFEIILYQSGDIECQYRSMSSDPDPAWATGASATVGLENVDASDYVLHSYNDPSGVFSPGGLLFTPI